MKKSLLYVALGFSAMTIVSCGGGENESDASKVDSAAIAGDTIDDTKSKIEEAQKVYYSIPSTSEMAELLQDAGAGFDSKILSDINNWDKYTTSRTQALNLGIYGADLNYCTIYERNNDVIFYMECNHKLAEKLGIENAISEETQLRAEENIDNRDSMMVIISDMFYELESYLAENDKDDISALVIGGGWIEGLYLATQTVNEKKPNKDILNRIAEQKMSLNNLIEFIRQYESNEDVKLLLVDLDKINKIYDGIVVEKQSTSVSEENGTTVIGGQTKVEITLNQFKALKKTVKEIRDSYTKF
jgi:hypothetical protein